MTEGVANLLVTKLNNTGHHAEVCELLADESSTIKVVRGRWFKRNTILARV